MAFSSFNSLQSNWSKNNVKVVKPYMMLAGSNSSFNTLSSIDGGTTWTPFQNTSTGDYFQFPISQINDFAANGTTIVCVGGPTVQGGAMAYSPDGIKWTSLGTSIFSGCNCITYNPVVGMFIAGGNGPNSNAYSYNGINWTGSGITVFTNVISIAYIGTNWLACGNGSTHFLASSVDGINWTGIGIPSIMTSNIFGIASNNNSSSPMWVVVGQGTNTIMYSTDSLPNINTVWTGVATSTLFNTSLCITYSGSNWIACGTSINHIATSPDGITWTGKGLLGGGGTYPSKIASTGANVVVVCGGGNSGGDNIMVSIDSGMTWSPRGSTAPTGASPNNAYGPGGGPMWSVAWIPQLSTFLIGSNIIGSVRGRNQYIISSLPLPINSATLVGLARTLVCQMGIGHPAITSNGSTILISSQGMNSSVISFDKGITWTVPELWPNLSSLVNGIISSWCSGFNIFITIGSSNSYYTSPTGETWTEYTSLIPTVNGFCSSDRSGVTLDPGAIDILNTMVCTNVGGGTLILTSQTGTTWNTFPTTTSFPISTGGAVILTQSRAVCWIPNLNTFIIVGRTGSSALGYILKSTDNGVTWIATQIKQTLPTLVTMTAPTHICWSPQQKRLVIVGSPPYIMYSDDIGVTWKNSTITQFNGKIYTFNAITWNSSVNKWFVCGLAYPYNSGLGTSIDGKTWTLYTPELITTANVGLSNIETLSILT